MYYLFKYKSDIEGHLGVTIPEVTPTFNVPMNEYDGMITYGEKKSVKGFKGDSHVELLSVSVDQLAALEQRAQGNFIRMKNGGKHWFM